MERAMDARHSRHLVTTPLIAFALLATLSASDVAYSQHTENELVRVELVADVQSIAPGRPFHLGVRFDIAENWHINWINPGDAGLAPTVAWRLPDGFAVAHVEWPFPRRHIEEGPIVIFGYSDSVILWTAVTPPEGLRPGGRIALGASVGWVACRDACVPGASDVSFELPVERGARVDTAWARAFDDDRRRVPAIAERWNLAARYDDHEITLEIRPVRPVPGTSAIGISFFPTEPGVIENAVEQRLDPAGSGFLMTMQRSGRVQELPRRLVGVLVSEGGWGAGSAKALQVDVELEPR
jgi:DsbC/DsbD-like thiol-disulfide interchange protein